MMAGPIARFLGLGAEEDTVNTAVTLAKSPAVAATAGAVTGLLVLGLAKVVLGAGHAATVIEVITGKGK